MDLKKKRPKMYPDAFGMLIALKHIPYLSSLSLKLSQFINTTLSVYLKRSLTLQYNKGKNIQLDGYNLLRADQPSNSKQGGVN